MDTEEETEEDLGQFEDEDYEGVIFARMFYVIYRKSTDPIKLDID